MKRSHLVISCVSFLATLVIGCGASDATGDAAGSVDISAADIRSHVRYLASDELEGRRAGTEQNDRAAAYIAAQLEAYGIVPAWEEGYEQEFEFVVDLKTGPGNSMVITTGGVPRTLSMGTDFRPLGFSENGRASGQLVFAGYGISAPSLNYDDYAGLDVTGKIVVMLRFGPDGDSPRGEFSRHTLPRLKVRTAREKGAAGIIMITGPRGDTTDEPMKLRYDQTPGSSGIPAVSATRAVIEPLLGKNLKELQDSIASQRRPSSFAVPGVEVTIESDLIKIMGRSHNVVGYLRGNDPTLADQVLVLGAHFDHIGLGGEGSGSLRPDTLAPHNGADDNASGTAGLLELAQKFSAERETLRRTVVFAFFSAEELGTLGSLQYANHPPFPLEKTVAMLNMDMVGRLTNKSLTVHGSGTSPAWAALLQKYNADSAFTLTLSPDGIGPSDHAVFYGRQIPVLFFFTGIHDDYHKPSDDWEKLNYQGEERIVRYVYDIARDVLSGPERPAYARVETQGGMGGGDSRGFSVTLGIVPEYAEGTQGMKIGGIRPNGPAEKAGLKTGDLMVALAGKKILNIYDYMGVLGELKAGDVVDVEVMREGKLLKFTATMAARK